MKARSRPAPQRKHHANAYARYESLKASLTAKATNAAEYEAACRQDAKMAGV